MPELEQDLAAQDPERWAEPRSHRRRGGDTFGRARELLVVVMWLAILGVFSGVLWWLLTDLPVVEVAEQGPLFGAVEAMKQVNSDAVFAAIALVVGLASGALLAWTRGREPVSTVLGLIAGGLVASFLMQVTGEALGPGDLQAALEGAEVGSRVKIPLELTSAAAYVLMPLGAVISSVFVFWGTDGPAKDRPPGS